MTATIFVSGRNCAPYVSRCLESLKRQIFQDFHILFIDDASTDQTAEIAQAYLQEHFQGRHTYQRNSHHQGKSSNAYTAIKDDSEFTAILDADDELIDDGILAQMAEAYSNGYDIVWTNYITDDGRIGGNGPLDPTVSPRTQRWSTSHFFSFRTNLFFNIPASYFKDDAGHWLKCACDFSIAFPLLDQTRRYLHLPAQAYRYTATNPSSHHNQSELSGSLSSPAQIASAKIVLSRKPLPCTRPFETHPQSLGMLGLRQQLANAKKLEQLSVNLEQRLNRLPFRMLSLDRLVRLEKNPAAWLSDAGGWALDAEFLSHLTEVLDHYKKPRVLEFGSGRGSKILARIIKNRGGTLHSIEHNEKWAANTHQDFEENGLSDSAKVVYCPLTDVSFFDHPGRFYNLKDLDPSLIFDVVIIDGPPAQTCALARLPSLASIAGQLSPKGYHLFLDDYDRREEKQIVEIWKKLVPELKYIQLDFDKSVCQITN